MATSGSPPSQAVQPGEPIRFAVGCPEGPRSQTWTIVSSRRDGDVYLGVRDRTQMMRLSLRQSTWRLEYTAEWARAHLALGEDRLISSWAQPAENDGGWRRAVTIVVPSTSLADEGWGEPPSSSGGTTAFWPAPPTGSVTQFEVLLGSPGHWRLTTEFAGEVGRAALAGAGALWVVVHHPGLSTAGVADIARRHAAQIDPRAEGGRSRGWSAAVARDDGQVVLFDFTSDRRWWENSPPVVQSGSSGTSTP